MKRIFVLMIAALMFVMPLNIFAEGGNGDGTGGGKDEALKVESASIEDGAAVEAGSLITLVFSKNVVNASVCETNKPLFSVQDENGNTIEAEIVMADDQVEPDKKNDVVIQLPSEMAEGSYTVVAKSGITSKSGEVMKNDYTLTFTVGSKVSEETTESDTSSEEVTESAQTESSSEAISSESEIASSSESQTNTENGSFPIVPVAVVVVVVIVGIVVFTKKKQ